MRRRGLQLRGKSAYDGFMEMQEPRRQVSPQKERPDACTRSYALARPNERRLAADLMPDRTCSSLLDM